MSSVTPLPAAPPAHWRKWVIGRDERQAEWDKVRNDAKRTQLRTLQLAQAKLDAGSTDMRTVNLVANGGFRQSATPEEAKAAQLLSFEKYRIRRSEAVLDFRREHANGCSIAGCPLGTGAAWDSFPLLALLEHDHVSRATKKGHVTRLGPERRLIELPKTQSLCLWHHYQKTCSEYVRVAARKYPEPTCRGKLRKVKLERGCEHPLHAGMPYASLMANSHPNNETAGFLHVSHSTRGDRLYKMDKDARSTILYSDLSNDKASVCCKFCHALYTLCEGARLYTTPLTQNQFGILLKLSPAFVQHFDVATSGFDWDKERQRMSTNKTKGWKRKREQKATCEEDESEQC